MARRAAAVAEKPAPTVELVRYVPPTPVRLTNTELDFIANSELMPKAYRGKKHDIFACVALGRQLGISDMHALRAIYVVDGKATISAELMVTLARQRGHSITADYGEDKVTVKGKRIDNGDTMSVTWTAGMAERAGLSAKDNWRKYPEAMLWARGVSQLCRMLFPDVLSGISHTPDEAELTIEERIVEGVGELVVPAGDDPDDSAEGGEPPAPISPTGALSAEATDDEGQQGTFEQLAAQAGERRSAAEDADPDLAALRAELETLVTELGALDSLPMIAEKAAAGEKTWLKRQITTAKKAVEKAKAE